MKIRRSKLLAVFLLACLSAAGLRTPDTAGYAASPANLILGKTTVPEGDDFATRVLALPWNMNGNPYPDEFTALKNIDSSQFEVTADGFWAMESTNTDPRLWLHWTGVGTTQRVLRMGDTRPIDASKYTLLSYYMCLDQAPSQLPGQDDDWAAKVYWMYDRTPHDDPANGSTNYMLFKQHGRFKTPGTCELIVIDLTRPSGWAESAWDNSPRLPMGLRIDPINQSGKTFRIGWARLTTKDTGNTVPMTWNGAPAGTVKFFLSLTGCDQNGILVGTHPNPSGSGTFNWGAELQPGFSDAYPLPIPESFEPGEYHVYMQDVNGVTSCASGQLNVHPAPILEFQKPSFYSGPDYAANVVGDPWGMANGQDITGHGGITNPSFNDGVLSASSTGTDPLLFLNVQGSIDSGMYRYATMRMKVNGQNTGGIGWVQRYIWWYAGPGNDSITTQDMQLYEGWHTYTIDLDAAGAENCSNNCWSAYPSGLRIDPHEANNTGFSIDFVALTGIDTIERGNVHAIHYTLPNTPSAEVTFFYDNDKNPANGRNPLVGTPGLPESADDPLAVFKIYIPALFLPGEIDFFSGSLTLYWNTSPVPENTWYISADVSDGVMTTTWYSEAPVIVK